jgi:hypothetical protein
VCFVLTNRLSTYCRLGSFRDRSYLPFFERPVLDHASEGAHEERRLAAGMRENA